LSSPFAGQIPSGNSIDGGRATSVPTQWALDAFNALPSQGVSIAGYTFGGSGGNVAWFGTGIRPPNNDPIGDARADCDAGFQGWALDADNLFAQLGVAIVIKWPSDPWGPANYTIRLTANQPIPNPPFDTGALARFGVGGNRGYTVPIPDQFKIGQPYNWMAIAANAPGTSGNPLGISIIGQGNFSCPSPFRFDVRPDIPQINDDGVVSFNARNIGNGESRYSGNVGVLFAPTVWVNGAVVFGPPGSWQPRAIIAPGNTWSATRGGVFTYRVPNLSRGDVICAMLRADPTAGVTGGAVTRGPLEAGGLNVTCLTYFAKPYFRAYGGDIVVGKPFVQNGQCSATKTNAPVTANYFSDGRGAGAQFAISAINKIDANSSMLRLRPLAPPPKTPIDLSFGNYENSNKVSIGSAWKDLGAFQGCIADYIEYYNNNKAGFKTLSNTFSKDLNKNLYYRDGDLSITENINPVSTEWSKIEDIKTNVVIVKGDINIDPDVTELNGIFIALPRDDGTGGTINTCKVSNDSQQFAECNQKLTVFGSFIANDVELRRIKGAKLTATTNEQANSNNIAEVFQYVPELYISGSNSFTSDQTEQKIPDGYDSVISLPPFL